MREGRNAGRERRRKRKEEGLAACLPGEDPLRRELAWRDPRRMQERVPHGLGAAATSLA